MVRWCIILQVALVTGGDSGIGRAIVLHLAREGADVAISYLDEHPDAEESMRAVTQSGQQCILLPGDLRSEDQCKYAAHASTLLRTCHISVCQNSVLASNMPELLCLVCG